MASNGFVGFKIGGTGNKLKSNATSNNTGNEYEIGAGNVDQTGNNRTARASRSQALAGISIETPGETCN